jgi:hypothetical protein
MKTIVIAKFYDKKQSHAFENCFSSFDAAYEYINSHYGHTSRISNLLHSTSCRAYTFPDDPYLGSVLICERTIIA